MNHVRQLEVIKNWHKLGILNQSQLHRAIHAPVFEWNPAPDGRKLTEEEQVFVKQNIMCGTDGSVPTTSPFDVFRISRDGCFDLWFKYSEERKWVLHRCAYEDDKNPEQWYWNIYAFDAGHRCEYMVWVGGKLLPKEALMNGDKVKPEVREIMQMAMSTLCYFIFETMHPSNCIVKCEPKDQPGRSVEWRLSRTHYLLVNHKQAETMRKQKSALSKHQLVRGAHWRKAHFRKLMAERFKNKRVVPVRKTWVGPTEWEGLDGKIYKVINTNPT